MGHQEYSGPSTAQKEKSAPATCKSGATARCPSAPPIFTSRANLARLTVLPVGEPLFSETATHISIEDEAAGEFIAIEQHNDGSALGKIVIDPDEWPAIRDAVQKLLGDCRASRD